MPRRNVLIDTDISLGLGGAEIDDGAALIAMCRSDEVDVVAVTTTFGNATVTTATSCAERILAALGCSARVVAGADRPVTEAMVFVSPWETEHHLVGGQPATDGARAIIAAAQQHLDLEILALGPLTNLALAITIEPSIVGSVKHVYAMGGDASPHGEFNFDANPDAVAIVLEPGIAITLFGLDITKQASLDADWFESLPDDPALSLLRDAGPDWIDTVIERGWSDNGCSLHDTVPAIYMTVPGIATVTGVDEAERTRRSLRAGR